MSARFPELRCHRKQRNSEQQRNQPKAFLHCLSRNYGFTVRFSALCPWITYLDCGSSYSRMVELRVPDTFRLEDRSVLSTAASDGGTDGSSSPPIITPGSELRIFT